MIKGLRVAKKNGADKKGKRTTQLSEDVVYWLGLIASYEDLRSINDIADPILRPFARERLKTHGVDPDDVWKKKSTTTSSGEPVAKKKPKPES